MKKKFEATFQSIVISNATSVMQRGIGVGMINTSFLANEINSHGIGLHFGIITEKNENGETLDTDLILFYTYYINGLTEDSWYFGGGLDLFSLSNIYSAFSLNSFYHKCCRVGSNSIFKCVNISVFYYLKSRG